MLRHLTASVDFFGVPLQFPSEEVPQQVNLLPRFFLRSYLSHRKITLLAVLQRQEGQ